MLKIGEFSKLSRISIRMLRHYDEIGLLKPCRWMVRAPGPSAVLVYQFLCI